MLPPKQKSRGSGGGSEAKRPRKVLTLVQKIEILDKLASGMTATNVGKVFGINESTVRTISRSEEQIRGTKS